jgi:hypothetical protein
MIIKTLKQYYLRQVTRFLKPKSHSRNTLFFVALEHYPGALFKTSVGITLIGAPFLLNYFNELGVHSLVVRVMLNGLVVVLVPAFALFIYSLFKSPKVRRNAEADSQRHLDEIARDLLKLRAQESREAIEVARLQAAVVNERVERQRKNVEEQNRWRSLNERLLAQESSNRLDNDLREERDTARQDLDALERISVARQVLGSHEEEELARREVASVKLLASQAKDQIEDDRWERLNAVLLAMQRDIKRNNFLIEQNRDNRKNRLEPGRRARNDQEGGN